MYEKSILIINTVTVTAASLSQNGQIAAILADIGTVMYEFWQHTLDSQGSICMKFAFN